MKLIEFNWRPTDRQLRQFGVICLFVLPAIDWLRGGGASSIAILGAVGLIIASAGMVVPQVLKPAFLTLMIATTPIGMVIGELAMLFIYFGVFLPIGIAFRFIGRDVLQRKFERSRRSYWETKKQPANMASYYRQS